MELEIVGSQLWIAFQMGEKDGADVGAVASVVQVDDLAERAGGPLIDHVVTMECRILREQVLVNDAAMVVVESSLLLPPKRESA
jgi:hypothetical protein